MKISTRGRYGLRILIDIAASDAKKPRMIKDIAASQGISPKYISTLIIDLRNAGFIKSIRGVRGGFVLARPASAISILEVVEAMEGEINIVDCESDTDANGTCPAREIWKSANDSLRNSLGWMTLASAISSYTPPN